MATKQGDMELLWWLIVMGQEDRELYRVIREAMWTLYQDNAAERSPRSDKPSNSS